MKFRILSLLAIAAGAVTAQVSNERLLHPEREPQNWLTYSGSYSSQRYSLLDQITPQNVKNLELQWVFQARSLEKFEVTPLVVDGVMYIVEAPNHVFALDAKTGRAFWDYDYRPSRDARPCCGSVNRGLAILGDTLFMGTLDARLLALDAKTGRPLWKTEVGDPKLGYTITHAPLVVKNKVVVGVAGGEYGIRGFIAAYDAATGKEAWKFYTIPGPGEPGHDSWTDDSWAHGGVPAWLTGSYDPELNLIYWGTGNPGPDFNGDKRQGDNLYSDSAVALDADSGKLKWYFQFTPHDEYDYDAVQIPVIVDGTWKGAPRKMLMWANRNGYFYVLDRTNGKFLTGTPFIKLNWSTGLDEAGRPMRNSSAEPNAQGVTIFPHLFGGTNWYSPSYSPRTHLFYIPTWQDSSMNLGKVSGEFAPGQRYMGGTIRPGGPATRRGAENTPVENTNYGAILAVDPATSQIKWQYKMADLTASGVLTTASDLLFAGGREGYFYALDARTGAELWRASLGGSEEAAPMTYKVGDKQYVTIAAGQALFTFALRN
ncbi:MAG TPA: PQQ-dependent dehydrogenase, methanol/ethanol family [Bryobacteraceae bacterium]|nr:PQQ-dependent dehydrogenase, methanol/ethanol family [Bryobacteraceae bacterium]